jgi:hypothetical protein
MPLYQAQRSLTIPLWTENQERILDVNEAPALALVESQDWFFVIQRVDESPTPGIKHGHAFYPWPELESWIRRGLVTVASSLPLDWEATAKALWQLLDNIDTLSDSVKPNPLTWETYVRRVDALVQKRHKLLKSDGYNLTKPESPPVRLGISVWDRLTAEDQ